MKKLKSPILWAVLFFIAVAVIVYLVTDSPSFQEIEERHKQEIGRITSALEQANAERDRVINESQTIENEYLEIVDLACIDTERLENELRISEQNRNRQKAEIGRLRARAPVDPLKFKALKECREKYSRLQINLQIALKDGMNAETSLKTCEALVETQNVIIENQQLAHKECSIQKTQMDLKIENFKLTIAEMKEVQERTIEDMKRQHRVEMLKAQKPFTWVVGIMAGYTFTGHPFVGAGVAWGWNGGRYL